jgi:hypothetical protein
MTRAEFLAKFPKASESTLRLNAEFFGWPPEAPARTKRRTLAQIVTQGQTKCLPPKRGSVTGRFFAFVPVPIRSEANISSEHWRTKAKHVAGQRAAVAHHLAGIAGLPKPAIITFVRIGRRSLDDDNLAAGFKHVRDEVAKLLRFDDRDASVKWEYLQITDNSGILGFNIFLDWA